MAATPIENLEDTGCGPGTPEREAVLAAYRETRARTEALARPLAPEDQQAQSMDDASPTKWHLAHVTWFFETFLLAPFVSAYEPFHPDYGYIFNSYYESVGPRHARPRRGLLTRPPLADVMAYRTYVDEAMARLIEDLSGNRWAEAAGLVVLGIHHEQQHQELLLTDIKHAFGVQPLRPAYRDDLPVPGPSPALPPGRPRFCRIAGGEYEIGHDGRGFCFDNETPRHHVRIEDFELARRPVTNGEFAAFIEARGYETATLWLADGWAWVQDGGGNLDGDHAPLYWRKRDGEWWDFALGGPQPLDSAAPAAHLTYYEADAFARFAGYRLPTEAEWEVAAARGPGTQDTANLMAAGYLQPMARKAEGEGLDQLYGDVWEWTASAYAPYPGFRPRAGAVGEYNGKFMVNQMVLKGGSCATPPGHIRASYRNFFYPHQNWQFTGLRLAADG